MMPFRRQPMTSAGLLLAAVSAIIAISAVGRPIVSGPGRVTGLPVSIDVPGQTMLVLIVAGALLLVAISVRAPWAKLVGAAIAFGLAGTEALTVGFARASTRFHPGATPHLEAGGILLVVAFIVAMVGVVVMIVGARELMPPPAGMTIDVDAAGLPVRPGAAMVALGFSLLGLIFFPTAPVGVILGLLAYWQITRATDNVPGQNIALTAIILGTTFVSLWTILVFGRGIWSAHGL
jgi:hypothetical protein